MLPRIPQRWTNCAWKMTIGYKYGGHYSDKVMTFAWADVGGVVIEATHWMEIPSPPNADKSENPTAN